jgi:hypothetical protein
MSLRAHSASLERDITPVRAEPVEALSFFKEEAGQPFDKLRANGLAKSVRMNA